MNECPHGDYWYLCPTCQPPPPMPPAQGTTVTARYPGTCVECDQDITEGDPITPRPDDLGWVHEECR